MEEQCQLGNTLLESKNTIPPTMSNLQISELIGYKTRVQLPPRKYAEFSPSLPCESCFPYSRSTVLELECVGIRNLLKASFSQLTVKTVSAFLKLHFNSVQLHWGQMEYLKKIDGRKIFLVKYTSPFDLAAMILMVFHLNEPVLLFHDYQENIHLLLKTVIKVTCSLYGEESLIVFYSIDTHFQKLLCYTTEANKEDIFFIPVSISYECPVKQGYGCHIWDLYYKPKSAVRINIGHSLSIKDLKNLSEKDAFLFKHHIDYEIWKNTAILPFHLFSLLSFYKSDPQHSNTATDKIIEEFQKEYYSNYDTGFIGESKNVSKYGKELLLSVKPITHSVAADVIMHEALLVKSIFSVLPLDYDDHCRSLKINVKQILANFRCLTRILQYEIRHLRPPCSENTINEKETLECLLRRGILTYHSNESKTIEEKCAHRLANNLDLDFEDGGHWDNYAESHVFVDIPILCSWRWTARFVDPILYIYYTTAKHLLNLHIYDVIEDETFVNEIISAIYQDSGFNFSDKDLRNIVNNSLKSFIDFGILSSHSCSTVTVIFLSDQLDEPRVLELIEEISSFVN